MELSVITYCLLGVTGFFAGFIDSMAGGGGIITVPVLLSVGLPPHMALGTNKLQASFGSFTSAYRYYKKGLYSLKETWPGILFTLMGAIAGSVLIQNISADLLNKYIPFLLITIFIYTLASPSIGSIDKKAKLKTLLFFILFGLLLGFYDGFFGPGTGSFWTISLIIFYGLNLKSATATTKLMNFTSNIVSLTIFIIGGNILLVVGLIMGLAQIAGAWLGSHLVIKHSTRFIRVIFLCVVGLTIVNMIWKQM